MASQAAWPTGTIRSLAPLPRMPDDTHRLIQIAQFHRAQFAGPQSAGVEQFEDRHVAEIQPRFWVWRGDQLIHLRAAEDFRQRLFRLGPVELLENFGRFAVVAGEEPQHDPDRRQAAGDRSRGFSAAALGVKIFAVIPFVGGLAGFDCRSRQEIGEVFQVAAIGVQRILRQPAFSRKMPQQLPQPRLVDARFHRRSCIERNAFSPSPAALSIRRIRPSTCNCRYVGHARYLPKQNLNAWFRCSSRKQLEHRSSARSRKGHCWVGLDMTHFPTRNDPRIHRRYSASA